MVVGFLTSSEGCTPQLESSWTSPTSTHPCRFSQTGLPTCRGSLETGDILMDLTAKPMEVFGLLGTEGLVHEGMMAAAT